jgi:hypothetical protein
MKITLDIDYEIAEPIIVAVLKEQYELLLKDTPLGFEEEITLNDAYKLVLEDFMGNKEFQKYVHNIAKKDKRYDSKKLIEANSGL